MLGDHDDDRDRRAGNARRRRSGTCGPSRRGRSSVARAAIGAEAVARVPVDQAARGGIGRRLAGRERCRARAISAGLRIAGAVPRASPGRQRGEMRPAAPSSPSRISSASSGASASLVQPSRPSSSTAGSSPSSFSSRARQSPSPRRAPSASWRSAIGAVERAAGEADDQPRRSSARTVAASRGAARAHRSRRAVGHCVGREVVDHHRAAHALATGSTHAIVPAAPPQP